MSPLTSLTGVETGAKAPPSGGSPADRLEAFPLVSDALAALMRLHTTSGEPHSRPRPALLTYARLGALEDLASPSGHPQEEAHQGERPMEEVVHIVLTFDRCLPHFGVTYLELVSDARDLACPSFKDFTEWLLRPGGRSSPSPKPSCPFRAQAS